MPPPRWLGAAAAVAAAVAVAVAARRRARQHVRVRAALDIGSGQHKLLVAAVDTRAGAIVAVLHTEQEQVLLNHALVQSQGGDLDGAILDRSFGVLRRFRQTAEELGATQFGGIATAVFRRASNGEAHLSRVNSELGLGLQIISQQLEGELGYLSAQSGLGAAGLPPGGLVAWDSGGGSFQMICHVDGQPRVWEGPLGDSNVAQLLLAEIQSREFAGAGRDRSTPNPVSLAEAHALRDLITARLPPPPAWLVGAIRGGARVVGFGERTAMFALAAEINAEISAEKSAEIPAEGVWAAVRACAGQSDAELLARGWAFHGEVDLAMPKLILMAAVIEAVGARGVQYVRTMGNCEGVAVAERLWRE